MLMCGLYHGSIQAQKKRYTVYVAFVYYSPTSKTICRYLNGPNKPKPGSWPRPVDLDLVHQMIEEMKHQGMCIMGEDSLGRTPWRDVSDLRVASYMIVKDYPRHLRNRHGESYLIEMLSNPVWFLKLMHDEPESIKDVLDFFIKN